jgi:hypothetical protein
MTTPIAIEQRHRFADKVCLAVSELPDRTSPDDWPEAMIVTADELHLIVTEAIAEQTLLTQGREDVFEQCAKVADRLLYHPHPDLNDEEAAWNDACCRISTDIRALATQSPDLPADGELKARIEKRHRIVGREAAHGIARKFGLNIMDNEVKLGLQELVAEAMVFCEEFDRPTPAAGDGDMREAIMRIVASARPYPTANHRNAIVPSALIEPLTDAILALVRPSTGEAQRPVRTANHPGWIDAEALTIAKQIAAEAGITDVQYIARIQIGAIEGIKAASTGEAGLRSALDEAIRLIDEVNQRKPSRVFYGIGQALHAKLATVRATLNRAALSPTPDSKIEGEG